MRVREIQFMILISLKIFTRVPLTISHHWFWYHHNIYQESSHHLNLKRAGTEFIRFNIVQYIPRNMHTVFALLCFVVVIHWLIFPYPSGLLHWHCGNLTIAPVPAKQPWWIWINTSCEFIMNDCITTTKQSTTKPCAYFLGYTVNIKSADALAPVTDVFPSQMASNADNVSLRSRHHVTSQLCGKRWFRISCHHHLNLNVCHQLFRWLGCLTMANDTVMK